MSDDPQATTSRRHLRFGWWMVALGATVGLVLELMHGLRIGWYLDVSASTRRLMLTLAHTHATLLGLVNVAYALTLKARDVTPPSLASLGLRVATILLPGGFLVAGLFPLGDEPGLGVWIVPAGALAFIAAAFLIAASIRSKPASKS